MKKGSKILFSDVYPYTPGKVDALVVISKKDFNLPKTVVLLPPYPGKEFFGDEDEFFRTTTVTNDQVPAGIDALEISTEAFLALDKPNPNAPPLRDEDEVVSEMKKTRSAKAPWNTKIIGNNEEGSEVVDED